MKIISHQGKVLYFRNCLLFLVSVFPVAICISEFLFLCKLVRDEMALGSLSYLQKGSGAWGWGNHVRFGVRTHLG